MSFIRRLFEDILPRLWRPNAWLTSRDYPLTWERDAYVNTMLDLGMVERVSELRASCGHAEIWVHDGAWAFSYGHLYNGPEGVPEVRPTYRTMRRLRAELEVRRDSTETQRLRNFLDQKK